MTDREVRALRAPGLHAVGGMVPGLALQVTQTPGNPVARSWVLRARVSGRRRALGLGPYPALSLPAAREKADRVVRQLRGDAVFLPAHPAEQRPDEPAATVPTMTFRAAAEQYIDERRASWKNAKHAQQWTATLRTYAYPVIGSTPVDQVDKAMVLRVVKPIWNEKTETAKRVKDRIKLVLGWAKAHGLRTGENPAEWRDNLEHALAAPERVARKTHQPAVPVACIGEFMRRLRSEQKDLAARALEFAILTAARDGEVRGATWDEIDLATATWTLPPERMKAGKRHRVPLSPAAVKLLKSVPRMADSDFIFPGSSQGGKLSENTLNEVIKRMHAKDAVPSDVKGRPAVVHGMRSTFRNWGRERTNFRPELLELALAHTVGNAAERAYARDDALEQRRDVMVAWAEFIGEAGG
jgi:integrase